MRARDMGSCWSSFREDRFRARWLSGLVFGGRQSEILGLCWPDLTPNGESASLIIRRN